jgi:AraC-like DNA-binding protein
MLSIPLDSLAQINLAGFVAYKKPWSHFKRTTEECLIYFIKSGELHILEGGIKYSLKKGDIMILQPGIEHVGFQKACCDYYYIHFSQPGIMRIPHEESIDLAQKVILGNDENPFCYMPNHYNLSNDYTFLHTVHVMNEMVEEYMRKSANYRYLIACELFKLFVRVSREYCLAELRNHGVSNPKSYIKVHQLLNYIHQHYHQKITSEQIESEFELNFDYFNRIFHQLTGYTIYKYLNQVRITKAKELIGATSIKFSEIGYLVGLNDPYYFSKLFKKYTGLSPMQYYKSLNIIRA